jgi:hypothetical protein
MRALERQGAIRALFFYMITWRRFLSVKRYRAHNGLGVNRDIQERLNKGRMAAFAPSRYVAMAEE